MEKLYVRLKPHNPKKGCVLERYTVNHQLFVGADDMGNSRWYEVSYDFGQYLKTVHQIPGDENTPLAFDVHVKDTYDVVTEKERNLRLVELGLASAAALQGGAEKVVKEKLTKVSEGRASALVDDVVKPSFDVSVAEVGSNHAPEKEEAQVDAEEVDEDLAALGSETEEAPKATRKGRPKKS